MNWKVLVTARSFAISDITPQKLLEDAGCLVIRGRADEGLRDLLQDVDGVIAGLESYTKEVFDSAPRLKIISRYGVGYDAIDLKAAKNANIAVAITPGANSAAVADLTIALMLNAARHIPFMDGAVKSGLGAQRKFGFEIWRKTLGIIGAGRVGKGVIQRSSGFEMRVLCCDAVRDKAFAEKYKARFVDLDTLLRESDFISIHTPLTAQTNKIIDSKALSKMKKNAVLINTARGGIIDEAALFKALCDGQIAACALDVLEDESSYDSELCKLPNCIITPHAGSSTHEATLNMGMLAAKNLLDFLTTGKCENLL